MGRVLADCSGGSQHDRPIFGPVPVSSQIFQSGHGIMAKEQDDHVEDESFPHKKRDLGNGNIMAKEQDDHVADESFPHKKRDLGNGKLLCQAASKNWQQLGTYADNISS
ncbi:unnamed protein product [Ilex paraguariensis]|uniref:Uncharacterized protein n=1 Tax=Ilex paraguariensis TaxID=185542 RepID=A0ABC8RNF2_9AQUA